MENPMRSTANNDLHATHTVAGIAKSFLTANPLYYQSAREPSQSVYQDYEILAPGAAEGSDDASAPGYSSYAKFSNDNHAPFSDEQVLYQIPTDTKSWQKIYGETSVGSCLSIGKFKCFS